MLTKLMAHAFIIMIPGVSTQQHVDVMTLMDATNRHLQGSRQIFTPFYFLLFKYCSGIN